MEATFPLSFLRVLPNMIASHISIAHDARGPNNTIHHGEASSLVALSEAAGVIQRGAADVMLAGGSEAPLVAPVVAGFSSAGTLSKRNEDPAGASRPFDLDRDGFVSSEGAAVLVLEEVDRARARGARIYGEVLGCGITCDANHMTAPDPEAGGAAAAMQAALADAGRSPDQVDYINAHGTATPANDRMEALAIQRVFGRRSSKIPVSSTKSMIGHTLGAAGAIEAVACLPESS